MKAMNAKVSNASPPSTPPIIGPVGDLDVGEGIEHVLEEKKGNADVEEEVSADVGEGGSADVEEEGSGDAVAICSGVTSKKSR